MLTTIVCVVALIGSHEPQRITLHLTEVNATELRQAYPAESLQQAVCTHLDHAIEVAHE